MRELLKMQTIVSQVYKDMIMKDKDTTAQISIMKTMNVNNIIIYIG